MLAIATVVVVDFFVVFFVGAGLFKAFQLRLFSSSLKNYSHSIVFAHHFPLIQYPVFDQR